MDLSKLSGLQPTRHLFAYIIRIHGDNKITVWTFFCLLREQKFNENVDSLNKEINSSLLDDVYIYKINNSGTRTCTKHKEQVRHDLKAKGVLFEKEKKR